MEGYISVRVAAEKWGVSERRINQYCSEGRIPGAERFGTSWAIRKVRRNPASPQAEKNSGGSPNAKKAPECSPAFAPDKHAL